MKKASHERLRAVAVAAVIFAAVAVMTYATVRNSQRHSEVMPDTDKNTADVDLGDGIIITGFGRYSGAYMEDGKNDTVTGIFMITIENRSEKTLQYGEITLTGSAGTAEFSVSTLPPKGKAVLLEKNRMEYRSADGFADRRLNNRVFFETEPTLCGDRIKIGGLDGKLNVTNISGKKIEGDVTVFYKNFRDGYYYGGITYRAAVNGGLEPGEVRQINAGHFSVKGSTVVFVTCP